MHKEKDGLHTRNLPLPSVLEKFADLCSIFLHHKRSFVFKWKATKFDHQKGKICPCSLDTAHVLARFGALTLYYVLTGSF